MVKARLLMMIVMVSLAPLLAVGCGPQEIPQPSPKPAPQPLPKQISVDASYSGKSVDMPLGYQTNCLALAEGNLDIIFLNNPDRFPQTRLR